MSITTANSSTTQDSDTLILSSNYVNSENTFNFYTLVTPKLGYISGHTKDYQVKHRWLEVGIKWSI